MQTGTFGIWDFEINGAGEGIRTPDRLVRSQVLYPAELHPHRCKILMVNIFKALKTKKDYRSNPL